MSTSDFMTKTTYIPRQNGSPTASTYLIALDIGYSAVKVFSPNSVAMFPSYAVPDNGNGVAGILTNDYIRYENLDTGARWFVGKMAHDTLSDEDTSVSESGLYGRNRYNDPMFRVITETGLGMACLMNEYGGYTGQTICVETGLPPRYISKGSVDQDALTEILAGTHRFSIQIGQRPAVRFNLTIDSDNVNIMPQPMGTLFSVAVANDHRLIAEAVNYFNKNVLIFDGGFGTLDLYPIKAHVIQNSETYDNLGMKRVLEETIHLIQDRYHKDIPVPAMQKYLESGYFRSYDPKTIATSNVPLEEMLMEANQAVCMEALQKLLHVYPLYEYDYLIVTGGTGEAWFSMIQEYLSKMETLQIVRGSQNDDLPGVFANVRGYYMFRYSDILSKKKAS